MAQVGIVGFNCATGLGVVTSDFYKHLPFAAWLVIEHPRLGVDHSHLDTRCLLAGRPTDRRPDGRNCDDDARDLLQQARVQEWLSGLDTIFAVERSYVRGLWSLANSMGINTVLMPNAEWFRPEDPEMRLVDCFIAPTQACAQMLERTGFGDRTLYIPHVVDTERFAFQQRSRANVFVHCRGWGGYAERKGTALVLEAARRAPDVQFIVHYQQPIHGVIPPNVTPAGPVAQPEEQYQVADVAIQPSRWEGVGLQILEAMSCGLPTIVTDAPPMNEYPTDKRLCVAASPAPASINGKPWIGYNARVEQIVNTIHALHDQPVDEMSRAARARMEMRSWSRLRGEYQGVLGMTAEPHSLPLAPETA